MGEVRVEARSVIGCMRVADLPEAHVPSVRVQCADCGEAVWRSKEVRGSFEPVCIPCIERRPGAKSVCLAEDVRVELHRRGWTDQEIERVQDVMRAKIEGLWWRP